jgi:hypothetical protein
METVKRMTSTTTPVVVRAHRMLAWILPALSVCVTVAFFVGMISDAPFMSQARFGRHICRSTIIAALLLVGMFGAVWIYGRIANAADARPTTRPHF